MESLQTDVNFALEHTKDCNETKLSALDDESNMDSMEPLPGGIPWSLQQPVRRLARDFLRGSHQDLGALGFRNRYRAVPGLETRLQMAQGVTLLRNRSIWMY